MTAYTSSPTIMEAFDLFKQRLELDKSYVEVVRQNYNAIKTFMENNIPGSRVQLIGSLQRQTKIDPLIGLDGFDIDVLVEVGWFSNFVPLYTPGSVSTEQALSHVETVTSGTRRYASAVADAPTISFPRSTGAKVEIVPAFRDYVPGRTPSGRAYWVPSNGKWLSSDYDYDAEYISRINAASGERLVPLIKMLRAWRRLHVGSLLRSYHLEVLAAACILPAIRLLENENRPLNGPYLTWAFFHLTNLDSQIPGTLSEPADYYMTPESRNLVYQAISQAEGLSRYAITYGGDTALAAWRNLFGKPFPGAQ